MWELPAATQLPLNFGNLMSMLRQIKKLKVVASISGYPLRAPKYENIGRRRNLNFCTFLSQDPKIPYRYTVGFVIIYETLYLIPKQHSGIIDGNIKEQ